MGKISYNRGTTYTLTHIWQKNGVNSSDGTKLFFTVKSTQYDTDTVDSDAILQKTVTMSGPTNLITINPSDINDNITPGKYYYDLKVQDNIAGLLLADSGTFNLVGTPTNRLA